MGVPKFFKWISERYPSLSEVVKDYQIPDFDNLYLDMNGIIHICSHPNDNDPHFRMTEEKMFQDIFHYIEVLFRLVQPKEVFFMAVDGVAPRAKMNQQRSRRFRSAREAVECEKKARDRGEVLPSEERFDSNCITPGTEFMVRLDAQLQYFVTCKISQDKMWQNCKVIYSGHQTPGEGEHKIMEYIRYSKSQPNYNPNTRHCLYGLDADLIMLGLTSHEPHFSLLREEVRFGGKQDNSRTPTAEETTFHLLHLSLMREYINLEFYDLRDSLPFKYNLENIIDDWVLMGFLVGNDFIPHLPHLHINKEALPILYRTYKEVMPTLDGYLNIGGKLHLGRFEKFMKKLAEFDLENFNDLNADLKYFNSKRSKDDKVFKGRHQRENNLEAFFGDDEGNEENGAFGALEEDALDNEEIKKKFERLGIQQDLMFEDDEDTDSEETIFDAEFRQHKREYYMNKMEFEHITPHELREQAEGYVRGIQWILNYYYNGVCSWSWYYPHHYCPYISDIKDFANMEIHFEMGKPFQPFEQLLAVLPPISMKLLPTAYHDLMLSENSPLKKFYPETFRTDLNGKLQDWEAVVLIPFIDEEKLLTAMKPCNERLTKREKERNCHGPMYICTYTPDNLGEYKAPAYYPPVGVNHNKVELICREEWELPPERIYKGLCKGVILDAYFAGFPSLKHVYHTFHLAKEGVRVFSQASREESYILDVKSSAETLDLKNIADQLLGKVVFVSWPHLIEALVEAVSNNEEKYTLVKDGVQKTAVTDGIKEQFNLVKSNIATTYQERWGIAIGNTHVVVYAKPMTGRKYVASPCGRMTLEKEWSNTIQPYAYQVMVKDLAVQDLGYRKHLTPQEYFPPRSKVFMLGQPHYGCMGEVIEIDPSQKGRIRVAMTVTTDPNLEVVKQKESQHVERYMTGSQASHRAGIYHQLLARITGTVFLAPPVGDNPMAEMETRNKLNIGLNLKNNRRNEEVIGYTRKIQEQNERPVWLYSERVIEAIREYQEKFPEVFDYMSRNSAQRDIFYQNDMFPENYKERVAELTTWLKSAAFAKSERQPCGTLALGETISKMILEEVDKVSTIRAKAVKMQVRPHLLFKPNPYQGSTPPDRSVTYKMFDRVVNVREGHSVPLGAKGTVVGIQPASKEADIMYDILFDEAFNGALTLRGPATAKRCYRLHWAAMINISHGSRLATTSQKPPENRWNQSLQQTWNQPSKPSGHSQYQQNRQTNKNGQFYQERWQQDRTANMHQNLQPQLLQGARGRGGPSAMVSANSQSPQPGKNSQSSDPNSPQPPDPNQLPSPSGLRMISINSTNGGMVPRQGVNHRNQQDNMIEIRSASQMQCAVHGTFYSQWSRIVKHGISRVQGRKYIPCYPFVPQGLSGSKAYQLLIFLDVQSALDDGMRFFKTGEKQLLCSGDRQGVISPKYFDKVLDRESETIIFPPRPPVGLETISGKSQFPNHGQGQIGHGRGKAMASQQPKGMQLYQNIWSQLQGTDQGQVDLRPAQSQMLSHMLNISNNDDMQNVSSAGVKMNGSASASALNTGRKEVSVHDIFKGAMMNNHLQGGQNNPNIISMLSAAHQSFSVTQQEAQNGRGDSPVKSAFVPTQVIRNQTPRKPRHDQQKQDSNQKSAVASEPQMGQKDEKGARADLPVPMPQVQKDSQQQKGLVPKPKRNRLAVKFNQQPEENTSHSDN
ncbi:5'-3' exoribonuclease 1-like isoform X1 [Penaeus chinensis]|uniref:5'-3' exoribonuclease 1-like isoform X1 n=1 Tax=Penaeus chinensis TaxID=139456 RepID=UPI001FB70F57|nr:5'-3' exoribonuclease 1-like isoform X1 [Penaeus chinensis]